MVEQRCTERNGYNQSDGLDRTSFCCCNALLGYSSSSDAALRLLQSLSQMLRVSVAGDVGASDQARSMVSKERDDVS